MSLILLLAYLMHADLSYEGMPEQPPTIKQYTTPKDFVFVRDMSREQKLGMMR